MRIPEADFFQRCRAARFLHFLGTLSGNFLITLILNIVLIIRTELFPTTRKKEGCRGYYLKSNNCMTVFTTLSVTEGILTVRVVTITTLRQ